MARWQEVTSLEVSYMARSYAAKEIRKENMGMQVV